MLFDDIKGLPGGGCDERRNAALGSRISSGVVSDASKIDRARTRAARLYAEALNCLAFAVGEANDTHAAALIDEALRLARRSRELVEG